MIHSKKAAMPVPMVKYNQDSITYFVRELRSSDLNMSLRLTGTLGADGHE